MRAPDLSGNGGVASSLSNGNGTSKQQNLTGRHTIVFRKGSTDEGIAFLRSAGFKVFVSNSSDPETVREDQVGDADAIVLPTLGVATIAGEAEQINQLTNMASDANSPILTIRPERVRRMLWFDAAGQTANYAPPVGAAVSFDYLQGYLRGFTDLVGAKNKTSDIDAQAITGFDESKDTWGLQATGVLSSSYSGRGVKVAVLDTGIDFNVDGNGNIKYHPDFVGRTIKTASFVPGAANARDRNGHGTHCIGSACGPRQPSALPGYGIAYEADIYAGKVLNDAGSGADGWILAGIEWAINQGCRVISMSLGANKNPGDPFNVGYEEVAQRALKAGAVIVAAAGNDSVRPALIAPVSGPADCPSIIAVAALDPQFQVAGFSNGGINSGGGEVNVAAPGVNVYSSFLDGGHTRLQGTSMATPHVAGIAALFAEANPSATGKEIWNQVVDTARQLNLGQRDVGAGMVQAPTVKRGSGGVVSRRIQGDVVIQETSPITIGGGGSVGLDFDDGHYLRVQAGTFVSPQDKLTTCDVIHQNGKLLRNFFPDINGNQCVVIITCKDPTGVDPDRDIRIAGGPSGQLALNFPEADFPAGANGQPRRYSSNRKVSSIAVLNSVTGASTQPYQVPGDFAGVIRIDN